MPSGDPWVRARRATEEMEKHLAAIARLADARASAIRELLDRGLTRAEIARRLGVTPAVVTKILKRPVISDPAGGREVGGGSAAPLGSSRSSPAGKLRQKRTDPSGRSTGARRTAGHKASTPLN